MQCYTLIIKFTCLYDKGSVCFHYVLYILPKIIIYLQTQIYLLPKLSINHDILNGNRVGIQKGLAPMEQKTSSTYHFVPFNFIFSPGSLLLNLIPALPWFYILALNFAKQAEILILIASSCHSFPPKSVLHIFRCNSLIYDINSLHVTMKFRHLPFTLTAIVRCKL